MIANSHAPIPCIPEQKYTTLYTFLHFTIIIHVFTSAVGKMRYTCTGMKMEVARDRCSLYDAFESHMGNHKSNNTVLNLAIGWIFAYLVLVNIFHIVCRTIVLQKNNHTKKDNTGQCLS